jgi:hypothetical protein
VLPALPHPVAGTRLRTTPRHACHAADGADLSMVFVARISSAVARNGPELARNHWREMPMNMRAIPRHFVPPPAVSAHVWRMSYAATPHRVNYSTDVSDTLTMTFCVLNSLFVPPRPM